LSKIIEFSIISIFSSLIVIGLVIFFITISCQYFNDFNRRISELTPNFRELNEIASKRKIIVFLKMSVLNTKVIKELSRFLVAKNGYFIIGG